jgi:Zn-dependent protease
VMIAALVASAPTGVGWAFLGQNLLNFVAINIFLAVFNLIPLPPFDGGHVVEGLLPPPLATQYRKLRRYGFLMLIILLLVIPQLFPSADIVERIVGPPVNWLLHLLLPSTLFA